MANSLVSRVTRPTLILTAVTLAYAVSALVWRPNTRHGAASQAQRRVWRNRQRIQGVEKRREAIEATRQVVRSVSRAARANFSSGLDRPSAGRRIGELVGSAGRPGRLPSFPKTSDRVPS